jgi:TruD family tRNA pseudouridine synthase
MNLDLAKSSGHLFLPDSVAEFMGKWSREAARLKAQPKHFLVNEQSTPLLRCTGTIESDIGAGRLFGGEGTGDLIAVTLVKKCLTTPAAIDKAIGLIGSAENRHRIRITYAGLKDRWAITAQRVVIEGASWDDVVRACMPDEGQLNDIGIFLKDPVRTNKRLARGHLVGNNFIIKVIVPGMSAAQLQAYVDPRVAHLTRGGRIIIPNAFGRQRLGKRQNLFGVGHDFIVHGPEVAIKRFLTETSPNESPWAAEIRGKLLGEWESAEQKAAATGGCVANQMLHLQGMRQILEQGGHDRAAYKKLNMTIEHRIVCQLLQHLDYGKAMKALNEDFSLWTGAVQGFWFNQVLAKVLNGEITLDNHDDPEARIPLYMDEQRAVRFYKRYAPEAVQERIDPRVRKMFMTTQHPKDRGPRRPLFVPVEELAYDCEDGAVNMRFRLPKGAYATTFLGILFNIEGDQDANFNAKDV